MTKITFPTFEKSKQLALERIRLNVQEALKDKLSNQHGKDTGFGQSNIIARIEDGNIIIEMPERLKYLEFGTSPHMPPVDALKGWVRRKFNISDPDEIERVAWALARHIAKFGTRPFPFIRQTFMQDVPTIIRNALIKSFR